MPCVRCGEVEHQFFTVNGEGKAICMPDNPVFKPYTDWIVLWKDARGLADQGIRLDVWRGSHDRIGFSYVPGPGKKVVYSYMDCTPPPIVLPKTTWEPSHFDQVSDNLSVLLSAMKREDLMATVRRLTAWEHLMFNTQETRSE